ncbi:hypothetical protein Droror1_Dr00024668 [Drosera rotundifolia]
MMSQNAAIIDNDVYMLDEASPPATHIATNAQSSVHASKHKEGSTKDKKRKGKLDESANVFLKRGFEAVTEALREALYELSNGKDRGVHTWAPRMTILKRAKFSIATYLC